jgi:predicted protein tyrosine phosphatase
MEIKVLSWSMAEEFNPQVPTLAMRIMGTSAQDKRYFPLRSSPLYVAVFEYRFDDLKSSELEPDDWLDVYAGRRILFDEKIARQMINHFMRFRDRVNGLMIQCYGGIGRSAGTASGLNEAFELGANPMEWETAKTNWMVKQVLIATAERMKVGKFAR